MKKMSIYNIIGTRERDSRLLLLVLMVLACSVGQAQIKIGGSVYGGGNEGKVQGNASVTLRAGNLNKVYGGARMADIGGRAMVNIDGKRASDYIIVNHVYGGNDISGTIGSYKDLPDTLTKTAENGIDNSWNAFVHISSKTQTVGGVETEDADAQPIYIGQLFGGGNGDYDYDHEKLLDEEGNPTEEDNPYYGKQKPELGKAYLELLGGSIVYAYGGGNNATVKENTMIYLDNPSKVVNSIKDNGIELLTNERFLEMGINTAFSSPGSDEYQIGRFFGGNNKAEMAIRPSWNLKKGKIRVLYSGGNAGAMTNSQGIMLVLDSPDLTVHTVFGGCRMANVNPAHNSPSEEVGTHGSTPYKFPEGYAAKLLVVDGDITDVYGGNDVSGTVFGGNALGIRCNIKGNVYGGGNGSYPYTDNPNLKDDYKPLYGEFYYDPSTAASSVEALNKFRPNAEKVSIRLVGSEDKHAVIHGAVYCGGNSATLQGGSGSTAQLKIGSHVYLDQVFLGNNGENMVKSATSTDVLQVMNSTDKTTDGSKFSSIALVGEGNVFDKYMEGAALMVRPEVVFDRASYEGADYIPYSSYIGSLYCGGNVGSIVRDGKVSIDFNDKIIVYNKVVGGCNNANVEATAYNAAYKGGVLGNAATDGTKLELNFGGLKIQPKRWVVERDALYEKVLDANGGETYLLNGQNPYLEWNTIYASTGKETAPVTSGSAAVSNDNDMDRRFNGGHIYGGCYNSGHVNGSVVININESIMDLEGAYALFDSVEEDENGEAKLNGHDQFNITTRRSGVIRAQQGMDVLGSALNVFGGGYGEGSEVWGGVTINLNKGYAFQVFGGGEKGAIGMKDDDGNYAYNAKYSTTINLKGTVAGQPIAFDKGDTDKKANLAETEFIYGGGFEGLIAGNTRINLGNGRVFDTFAGSCNADIYGHTETYIGYDGGLPYVRDDVYGGNDLGGRILGQSNRSFADRLSQSTINKVYGYSVGNPSPEQLTASAYIEYIQGRVDTIFGGCYGYYNYKDSYFGKYTYAEGGAGTTTENIGRPRPGFTKPRMDNAFVYFRPANTNYEYNNVLKIHGAGQGFPGEVGKDSMQHRSYVLIDIPQNLTTFRDMEVFGAGAYGGLGMGLTPSLLVDHDGDGGATVKGQPDKGSAIIDLVKGQIGAVYGASYKQGFTRRTVVNVPDGSTIHLKNIFGGAYGYETNTVPCDAYEAIVNYNSSSAVVEQAIYGGNNSFRRTLYGTVNIHKPVFSNTDQTKRANVYGAGYGKDTWSQYTEVNLFDGAEVQYVYGGGNAGMVLCKESVDQWREIEPTLYTELGAGYTDEGLSNDLAHSNELYKWDRSKPKKYNTNVHIYKGATVADQPRDGGELGTDGGYAYAGGEGADATVSGTTYIDVLGGLVKKDLYAGGYGGAVQNKFGKSTTLASATAYVEGGKVRKVYGGGYKGHVGKHKIINTARPVEGLTTDDVLADAYVVIGIREDQDDKPSDYGHYRGIPTVEFNAYGGGEGGSVFGTAHLTLNNGRIGYYYDVTAGTSEPFKEKIDDETWSDGGVGRLADCGNVFGAGYDDLSTCDFTDVTVWGGKIRNSLFGGGEIATVGRGATKASTGRTRELDEIYKHGKTRVVMYNGHVLRNVFGGGKGYNELKYGEGNMLYTDGYVFGQTEVLIRGGEVGTVEGARDQSKGYGNVFGGGDIGYVYGLGKKSNEGTTSPSHYYYYDANGNLTEDCKVVVSPYLQVKADELTINNHKYKKWDYVPTEDLNTISASKDVNGNWTGTWLTSLFTGDADGEEERGVTIHNAVFAGGNVSSNSDQTYANAPTVFGNTTATLYDVYHRDFITVGTEHIGGLYGGGNLSVVDGYRELNITNYGTDYYGLDEKISYEKYLKLSSRERAYFQLQYECKVDNLKINDTTYKLGDKVSEEDYLAFPDEYKTTAYWQQYGFCSIYAGRLLNTVQRADLCGVYGSRLVLQGAKDRVADVASTEVYTINRIGELSLNQQKSLISSDTGDAAVHGNYFGIYSIVNYLGHLTSDVKFDDPYQEIVVDDTGKESTKTHTDGTTYLSWKQNNPVKTRNIGTCHNQVALASGVYLEITTEQSTAAKKVYGDITGIVELDLINVRKDISVGGGYVYARNEHDTRTYHQERKNVILSDYNKGMADGSHIEARTYKRYDYSTEVTDLETSGNFIHRRKRIVDDCYPNNGVYNDGYVKSPAHYWYIKGDVYVYEQTVSAYVGSASAYAKEVKIPLTITAASNGKLQLLNVQPSRYAYYRDYDNRNENTKITDDGVKVDNETTTFYLNDVISWWDWQLLTKDEQKLFVKETYVNTDTLYVDGKLYPTGTYVLENDPSLPDNSSTKTAYKSFISSVSHTFKDKHGEALDETVAKGLFRSSNNISHDTGYVLTFDMDTPPDWNDWYTKIEDSADKKNKDDYLQLDAESRKAYREGPTFRLTDNSASDFYGQSDYSVGDVISNEAYTDYTTSSQGHTLSDEATFLKAYIDPSTQSTVSNTDLADDDPSRAMLCTSTLQMGIDDYLLQGEVVKNSTIDDLAERYKNYQNSRSNTEQITLDQAKAEVLNHLAPAYICTVAGKFGGQYFQAGQNYSAIKSWCSLTENRDKFEFNYDAFDVLADPHYTANPALYGSTYSDVKSVEYSAVYNGTGTLNYEKEAGGSGSVVAGGSITREEFEKIRNDQRHYTRIEVGYNEADHGETVYIVKQNFFDKGAPYAKGQDISQEEYNSLDDEFRNSTYVTSKFIENTTGDKLSVYYCYEGYRNVAEGTTLTPAEYNALKNYQKDFSIQGREPTETTMLYVSRESNIKDVTKEKIISVVYQYTYYDEDTDGEGVSLVNELHVVNIHLQLESGVPEIGPLNPPVAVIPGKSPSLKKPDVNPGMYEVLISGWELYTDLNDAEMHRNGVEFENNTTPVYWYQNQKVWVAFYSKTFLGKTYSNPVAITVANYHDLDAIMNDKEHHLYVDHPEVDRASKIYLDNRTCDSDASKSKLDLLKDFFDLSIGGSTAGTADHAALNDHVRAGRNLEFFLRSDVSPKAYTNWTPIGNNDANECFEGMLHGDGYTVSGLDNSLFSNLCGEVYNLGVTGTFTSAGLADRGTGYVENCWVRSDASTVNSSVKAVFGNPSDNKGTQIVNSYYSETNAYSTADHARGNARKMTAQEFYNGTVAYNLNGFYLNKRYYDQQTGNTMPYQYLLPNSDGTLPEDMTTGYYPSDYAIYPLEEGATKARGYVEQRFFDGDFVYASGSIPEGTNIRQRVIKTGTGVNEVKTTYYVPIWPDDYIYFGQMLTYGYDSSHPHEAEPSHVTKGGERLATDNNANRVYRAPAYFGSKDMKAAYYNPWAYFPAYSKPKDDLDTDLTAAFPGLTAIDFKGHGEAAYKKGLNDGLFYQPLLDDNGLLGITVSGQTQNLLIYAPSATDNQATNSVLTNYFQEPAFSDYDESSYTDGHDYNRVAAAPTSSILGHLVPSTLVTANDHLLVDKQDFNCPISYRMGDGYRMWYQRRPDRYVSMASGSSTGWEDVSLPFSTDLVTTQTKGELTHFFEGSTTGHEYWLRELRGIQSGEPDDLGDFKYPLKDASAEDKDYSNTFLWDYYYSQNGYRDANADTYQENYYKTSHRYGGYPRSVADKPYLIGFPGTYYYEFDLSGGATGFKPANTSIAIDRLEQQIITFASKASDSGDQVTIAVSDDAVAAERDSHKGYLYTANYATREFKGDDLTSGRYLLSAQGDKYQKLTADMTAAQRTALPFRPYFKKSSSGTRDEGNTSTRSIVFIDEASNLKGTAISADSEGDDLIVQGGKKRIAVESQLRYTADVRILTPAGLTVKTFTIQPSEYVETRVETAGVYIVEGDEGRYVKKVIVK